MEGLGMPEGFDEAVYLIEINNCVKDYLRKVMKPKVKFTAISGRSTLQLETSTGIPIQIPENTPFDDIKQAKKEALLKFFAKRPWIKIPNRESPIPRIIQILRALFHFSGQPFYITCEGDIQPVQ
ncbi:hypothetical protein TVAGG3_0078290 [Trichomonas vaginalis G3]|uniref:hypothetical protein n=2 Tax=Trichomonas vaginalis (strain ATCC PRA-98 / G3) TaxID=412133 RepID=UPI0021E5E67A|nr:hypothetical protein TVAGG3_0832430 [Trichomonas vaginalis G3]XP_051106940.1 hypothetical protein TVAGG3_0078290 [Trichomonas vaginalis G3]KAI5498681.1 hypothetical protein TVAGG3_0832430 [Trichomonas vaginalis G3]KAI5543054.1 hypothetical protein TVAGG3_0078290 [Trichomonas vaginalis G3]